MVFGKLKRPVFMSYKVSLRVKINIYSAMVLSILLYGAAESWVLSKSQLSRLETAHNGWLRCITRDTVGTPDSISTKDLMAKTHQLPISSILKERRLRWLGHVTRRPNNCMVKQLVFATGIPGYAQPIGRPHGTWKYYAIKDVKEMGTKLCQKSSCYNNLEWDWPILANSRSMWATIVAEARL